MSSAIIDNTSGKFEIREFNVGDIFARSIQSSIELPWVALLMGYSSSPVVMID